jgi:hypothetical protein
MDPDQTAQMLILKLWGIIPNSTEKCGGFGKKNVGSHNF